MKYLYCLSGAETVGGLNCPCGWKQPDEVGVEFKTIEIPLHLAEQIVSNWEDSSYYCKSILELRTLIQQGGY